MRRVMAATLMTLAVLSCARADDVSDAYNAGAGYAGSNKTQGTSAASGTDPAGVRAAQRFKVAPAYAGTG